MDAFYSFLFGSLGGLFFYTNQAGAQCFTCDQAPPGTIWCDDFEDAIPLNQKYFEYNDHGGDFIRMESVGRDQSYGMRAKWQKGEVGAGSLWKSFGKTPDSYIGRNAARPGESFGEIYWRMDVRSQDGWVGGGPAKLSRAMCLANSNWAQGMMAHLWSGGANDEYLGMDPATGIGADGKLKTTKYNDFANLRWLGFKVGNIPLYHSDYAGQWYCIVGHVKLNTPGLRNGIFEFWINDTLQASSTNLDWHSTWNQDPYNLHINAVFFENYWNAGSPAEQERYFDNLVISTEQIRCTCNVTSTQNPDDREGNIFFSNPVADQLRLNLPRHMVPVEVSIIDWMLRPVIRKEIHDANECIGLHELPNGVYLLHLKGQIRPVKFLVNH
ncbi:MAG: T9SS type A sorting domain-containing protein [Saprospiraceae bacterium]|nr:T9SS type A sorting domain-containing protein [Saprospiraceae bacterium]